ncbi:MULTISPECIES: hypothetical protein [Alistipes]|jgi:hypothetical protein|uniref:hypothetical protein n=1 Tax=Alistipes TaxID=239759 RepID=UPI000C76840B|nr:hypothetical protein [Alistipes sp. cv1]
MAKSTIKILRAFYREQDKEVSRKVDPDVDTQTLLKILSVPNPVVRIAKHRKLSFTTTEGDAIIVVNPDNTRTTIGTVENKDVLVTERTVPFQ